MIAMDTTEAERPSQMPEDMISFTIHSALSRNGPRVGRLTLRSRKSIATPNYVASTSRGVVPHLSQDNIARHTKISSLYFGIEDFIEKQDRSTPPIYNASKHEEATSALRTYTSQAHDSVLILGPRRIPPIASPQSNQREKLAICTSVGFKYLDVDRYVSAGIELGPDILLAPSDVVTDRKPSQKRAEKMSDRTSAWLRAATAFKASIAAKGQNFAMFAPILPIDNEAQSWYLRELVDDFIAHIDGLYVHDANSVVDLPEAVAYLPRIGILEPSGPSQLLHQISLGVDLFVTPLLSSATDAGTALIFSFPPPTLVDGDEVIKKPIGANLWDPSNATDLSPFEHDCQCYVCTKHHKAFLHHLLTAKEMLAWVLLQIHNHHVLETFFVQVRKSIANGTFEQDKKTFEKYYEPKLPISAGQGPRIRGYQMKSVGGNRPKTNAKAFNKFDDMNETVAEVLATDSSMNTDELENHGIGKSA